MNGFDYIRNIGDYYLPKTPHAAMLAVQSDYLPLEAFIYKASSAKSLFEEPYDLAELDRILARPNLDLGEAMLLVEIFWTMTHGKDKELALFAAESLGALENRWARRIEELGRIASDSSCPDGDCFAYARALYEYALIAGKHGPIRNYYLREAFYVLSDHPEARNRGDGFALLMRCLLRLGLLDQAEAVLAEALAEGNSAELLLLALETAYLRKDARRIRELLVDVDLDQLDITEEMKTLLASWTE
jgi:GNAT superfamily N-acetyltransferase